MLTKIEMQYAEILMPIYALAIAGSKAETESEWQEIAAQVFEAVEQHSAFAQEVAAISDHNAVKSAVCSQLGLTEAEMGNMFSSLQSLLIGMTPLRFSFATGVRNSVIVSSDELFDKIVLIDEKGGTGKSCTTAHLTTKTKKPYSAAGKRAIGCLEKAKVKPVSTLVSEVINAACR